MRRIAIIGAGGFARELRWLLSEIAADPSRRYEAFDVAGFLVSDRGKLGSHDSDVLGEYDFIYAKAKLAIDVNGNYPLLNDKAHVHLKDAYHPLLYLYNLLLTYFLTLLVRYLLNLLCAY